MRRHDAPRHYLLAEKEKSNMKAPNMRRHRRGELLALLVACAALVAGVLAPASASAEFGFEGADLTFKDRTGAPETQAGSHPYAVTTSFGLNYEEPGFFEAFVDGGEIKNLVAELMPGFTGDTTAMPRCALLDFLSTTKGTNTDCADETAVGVVAPRLFAPSVFLQFPVYNVEPPPGVAVRLAFQVLLVPAMIDITLKQSGEYNVEAVLGNAPQILTVFGGSLQLWGDPSDPGHDKFRGFCGQNEFGGLAPPSEEVEFLEGSGKCPVDPIAKPFLTLPRSCTGPAQTNFRAESWENPGVWAETSILTHDNSVPPIPEGLTGCETLNFSPTVKSQASTDSAESATGLDFNIDFNQEGLTSVDGLAQSDIKKAEVTLPEGMTINPSVGEGLEVCTPAQVAAESLHSAPGAGCPNGSKIGTVHVETPLVEQDVDGSVFLAQQDDPGTTTPGAENPFDSLIAFYIVMRHPGLGLFVKLEAKVEPDPKTGQLVTILDDAPQLPFSHFNFHFREGQRAPLVSPPACGTHTTEAKLYPWSDPANPRTFVSSFEITTGIGDGPCPPGGVPSFRPHFEAGSLNNNAGSHTSFNMRLIRNDGEQDLTKFSSVLPPGVVGKLAGVDKCTDAAVEAAKLKTGREELASPSCPANSQIGRSLAGAGVGGALTYVGGWIYLGGPYKGAPLSVISITPAVAGPFDAGTVVTRLGLDLNSETAEVEVDGAASDPIPHILKGIPLKVRDLRVYVDRENFILNPTSCDPSSARATIFGGFVDVFSPADDVPVDLSTRFQAANCLNLPYKPALKLNLRGGTKRGGHPGLKAVLTPRPGDANLAAAQATLPRSAFLDQAHIRTICTRVQFAANQCPPGSIYGFAKAWTPLLDEPFEGPAILRSSDNKLPDLVLALKGLVDVNVSSRIDSKNGGIRNTFDVVPDAPVSKFVLTLQGGKKGLIINSRDLCKGRTSRANIRLMAHNGRVANLRTPLTPQCKGKSRKR